jgi:hypothetical protein
MTAVLCVGPAYSAAYEIKILNSGAEGKMIFEPSILKVKLGDTVTFLPSDPLHDSISIHTPKDANTWHGKRDQKVSVTINIRLLTKKASIFINAHRIIIMAWWVLFIPKNYPISIKQKRYLLRLVVSLCCIKIA